MNAWLNRDEPSPAPLYDQLAGRIESLIRAGTITPGRILGNEIRLAARFGVSRATMRRAILELVDKGLLVRKRGVGTVVLHPPKPLDQAPGAPISRTLRLSSLFDDLTELGREPSTVVLTHEMTRPPQAVVQAMNLPPGWLTLHLRRLRYTAQRPLAIMENYLPIDVLKLNRFDPSTTGLYQAMRDQGISLRIAKQRIGARPGTEEECRLLDEPADSPVLTVDQVTHDSSGRVVEVASHLYRASLHEYTMTLVDR